MQTNAAPKEFKGVIESKYTKEARIERENKNNKEIAKKFKKLGIPEAKETDNVGG